MCLRSIIVLNNMIIRVIEIDPLKQGLKPTNDYEILKAIMH